MSTTIMPSTAEAEFEAQASPRTGLLRRVLAALIESRRQTAQRRIAVYFEGLSDTRLADLGFSAADIRSIRAHRWPGRTP